MKVLLIVGGWSTERGVSLTSAPDLKAALEELGHSVTLFDLRDEFDSLLSAAKAHDFAFINLHGSPGEDGMVQAMLDSAGCPYQGAGPAGSFLALHKACTKQIFRDAGLPTADWEFLPVPPPEGWENRLGYPVFVKGCVGGSSLRLGRADDREQMEAIMAEIFAAGEGVLLERALKGRDVTCAILGGEALPPILILPQKGEYFDYVSKYSDGGAKEICPAPISENATRRVKELAAAAVEALGLNGCGRVDFVLGDNDELNLLEVNTLPGMTGASLVPKAAAAAGLSFPALLARYIELGLKKN